MLLALCTLAAPRRALAQIAIASGSPILVNPDGSIYTESRGTIPNNVATLPDCVNDLRFRYTFDVTAVDPSYSIETWASRSGDCSQDTARRDQAGRSCWRAVDESSALATRVTIDVPIRNLITEPLTTGNLYQPGTAEQCAGITQRNYNIYFILAQAGVSQNAVNGSVTVKTVGPNPPGGISVGVGDKLLKVGWTPLASLQDLQKYQIYCDDGTFSGVAGEVPDAGPGDPDPTVDGGTDEDAGVVDGELLARSAPGIGLLQEDGECPATRLVAGAMPSPSWPIGATATSTTATDATVLNLNNDTPYACAVSAVDTFNNPGPLSAIVCARPTRTIDFFTGYKEAGGGAQGCALGSADNASMWVLSGLTVMFLGAVGRRRRR